jgi:TPP-dependent pyruvate/acetoin dehydrogenase alpha subunit
VNALLPPDELLRLYALMALIRRFEEQLRGLAAGGGVPGLVHLSSGQEAASVGACTALDAGDFIASNHRGHGHCLAKGAQPERLMAEILGKRTGYCGGRSGSLHVFDAAHGNLGTNGIVGGGVTLAAGAALAAQRLGSGRIAACFFGDGALNQGILSECMNMAAIWALPVLFICENNGYGEFTASEDVTAGKSLTARGEVFDIPSLTVDGMDVLAVRAAVADAAARARNGGGPSFIICTTYRFGGHHAGDEQTYKPAAEVQSWRERDPLVRFARYVLDAQVATQDALDALDREAEATVEAAVRFARDSPAPGADDLGRNLYA